LYPPHSILFAAMLGALSVTPIGRPVTAEQQLRGRLYQIPAVPMPERARSLRVLAGAANWDADAEDDGIELVILPLSDSGGVVPVAGQLSVSLLGQKTLRRHVGEDATKPLGRWSRTVRLQDFANGSAVFRLPFRDPNPTTDPSVNHTGLLHVQLTPSVLGPLEAKIPVPLRNHRGLPPDTWMR
jgi:hypothetical protein